MPRYVILQHETPPGYARPTHWDFMLEDGPALATWALEKPLVAEEPNAAEQLADHRRAYLDYEGPVSGDRGAVKQWDAGVCDVVERTSDRMTLTLNGRRCQGTVTFTRLIPTSDGQRFSVLLRKS